MDACANLGLGFAAFSGWVTVTVLVVLIRAMFLDIRDQDRIIAELQAAHRTRENENQGNAAMLAAQSGANYTRIVVDNFNRNNAEIVRIVDLARDPFKPGSRK